MLLLRYRLARFLELLPVRRVLKCLLVIRERFLRVPLLRVYIAPRLERIGPVRTALVRVLELCLGCGEISVLCERDAPREVRGGQIRGKRDCIRVGLLCAWPIVPTVENVAAESIAVHECAGGLEQRICLIRMSRRF